MTAFTQPAFRALFLDQRESLFRFLYRLTGNVTDAEDLLQDTFLTVWRKRDQFEGRGTAAGYLRRTAFRLFLNVRQVRARRTPTATGAEMEALPEASDESVERRDALAFLSGRVRAALDTLPEGAREAFVLFRFEHLSVAEIAETTGTPFKTVETRLRRATELLAEKLAPYKDHLPAS